MVSGGVLVAGQRGEARNVSTSLSTKLMSFNGAL